MIRSTRQEVRVQREAGLIEGLTAQGWTVKISGKTVRCSKMIGADDMLYARATRSTRSASIRAAIAEAHLKQAEAYTAAAKTATGCDRRQLLDAAQRNARLAKAI